MANNVYVIHYYKIRKFGTVYVSVIHQSGNIEEGTCTRHLR
jgi:hypothetical protein